MLLSHTVNTGLTPKKANTSYSLKHRLKTLCQILLAQLSEEVKVFKMEAVFDLRAICNALAGIKTKWFEIGIQLGIPRSKLEEFEEKRDPLSAVVDYWLKGNVTESVVPISWKSIVDALKSKYVGEPGLAEQIKQTCYIEESEKG